MKKCDLVIVRMSKLARIPRHGDSACWLIQRYQQHHRTIASFPLFWLNVENMIAVSRGFSMTKLKLSTTIPCLISSVLALAPILWAQGRAPILEKVAKTYGLDSWNKIAAIRYTWNGEIPGVFKLSRTWEWEPKTNTVTYEGKDKEGKPVKVTYKRTELSS